MNPHFTKKEQEELKKRLRNLEKVCHPTGAIFPKVVFKTKEQFDYFDTLETYNGTRIPPQDLQQMWEPQRDLNDRGLGFIQVNGEKWFYDKTMLVCNIFSQDGTKGISIEFPCLTDTSEMWSIKGTKSLLKKLISACQKEFPPRGEIKNFFPEDYCQKLYNKSISSAVPEVAILEMMETLRKILIDKLISNHKPFIQTTKAYQRFAKKEPSKKNDFIEFLRRNKNLIFILAEKLGYIKKSKSLIRYHQKRDHVRHPDEVEEISVTPQKILDDFYEILQISPHRRLSPYSLTPVFKNFETSEVFRDLVALKTLLSQKVGPQFKYNKKDFWKELTDKKVLTKRESQHLQTIIRAGNRVGHVNKRAESAKTKLVDKDRFYLENIICKLSEKTI